MGQEFGSSFAGWFWLCVMGLQYRFDWGCWKPASKVAPHWVGRFVLAVGWGTSFSSLDLSLHCLHVLRTWQLTLSRVRDPKEKSVRCCNILYDLAWEDHSGVISAVSYGYSCQPIPVWEGTTQKRGH